MKKIILSTLMLLSGFLVFSQTEQKTVVNGNKQRAVMSKDKAVMVTYITDTTKTQEEQTSVKQESKGVSSSKSNVNTTPLNQTKQDSSANVSSRKRIAVTNKKDINLVSPQH